MNNDKFLSAANTYHDAVFLRDESFARQSSLIEQLEACQSEYASAFRAADVAKAALLAAIELG